MLPCRRLELLIETINLLGNCLLMSFSHNVLLLETSGLAPYWSLERMQVEPLLHQLHFREAMFYTVDVSEKVSPHKVQTGT